MKQKLALMISSKTKIYDDLNTPPYALKPLIPYLNKDWVIWECAEGQGYLSGALKNEGFKVISTGIEFDFLKGVPDFHFDAIVTNPPYSIKDKFLEKAFSYNKPFAFLLPITALEGKKRSELYRNHHIQLIIPDKRISFIYPNSKKHPWFASMWLTFGLNLPKDLMFVKLER